MFSKVLVGVNGHAGGRDAIALATKLLADDGDLTLAHVYSLRGDPPRLGYNGHEAVEYARAREVLETAADEAGVRSELRWRGCTSPGRGLHELAELLESDLLVVGSTERSLFGRVMIGDDTRAALDGAPCAVAIAPAGYSEHPRVIRKIGVGYDGSPDSRRALKMARTLAGELGTKLAALEVVSSPARVLRDPGAGDNASIQALISEARERVASVGGDLEPHSAYGHPAEELALWAATVDLLVVGSRGYGPVGRLVHGSTSRALTRAARCPLLVLTRSAAVAAAPPPLVANSTELEQATIE
jgi:nucleotide-binding universal stress UspA family protein